MHSEHITNLHPGWVAVGWVVAVAVASGIFLALVGTGFLQGSGAFGGAVLAVVLGFFAGGLFVGLRWSDAPILHGIAITLLSVLVWFLATLLTPASFGGGLRAEDASSVLGSILLQLVAAVAGGLAGRALVLRGQVPDPASLPPEA